MTTTHPSILLVGATGNVGARTAALLAGHAGVRALARSDDAAAKLAASGLTPVRGDLADPASLREAFAGVDRLLLITPFSEEQAQLEHNALDAAEQAGVRGVVYLSLTAADLDIAFARPHAEIEARLAASTFEATVLRPDFFYQNLYGQAEPLSQGQIIFPAGDGTMAPIDVADIAAAVAHALTAPAQPTGTFTLTGPQRLTLEQLTAEVGAALNRDLEFVDAPAGPWADALIGAGWPKPNVDGMVEMFETYKQTGGTAVAGGFTRLTGQQPRSVQRFVVDELAAAVGASAA